jgi:hypothetical protein
MFIPQIEALSTTFLENGGQIVFFKCLFLNRKSPDSRELQHKSRI